MTRWLWLLFMRLLADYVTALQPGTLSRILQVADSNSLHSKVALITGAAKRIGAADARLLHAAGMNIIIHCRHSREPAEALATELNALRENSAHVLQLDLDTTSKLTAFIEQAVAVWGRLDALINNASSFYPTPVGSITEADWDKLFNSNLKAPLFLSQAAAPHLHKTRGCIINMVDVHAFRPMRKHSVYCAAKAALAMLTQSLARELGPEVRVNGIAPGAILWPEQSMDDATKATILDRTALKRPGEPADIARTVLFLIRDADYITGQIIAVDGGRSLNI
jgi:pteridine reductase